MIVILVMEDGRQVDSHAGQAVAPRLATPAIGLSKPGARQATLGAVRAGRAGHVRAY